MINEPDGLDKQGDRVIRDDDMRTWRMGEEVEATLVTERGPGTLIKVGHVDGAVYLPASAFAEVRPVGEDPDHLAALKTLRTQLVEERLAAATARSETAMAKIETGRVADELRKRSHQLADLQRQHRLAMAALRFAAEDTTAFANTLETLLGTEGRPGSIPEPCNAVLEINERYPGCGCDEPCWTTVASLPCMLRRGHPFVLGKEKHRTLTGVEFETGETVVVGEDD